MVADMSSEYMARPLPWDKFDLVYGGAQKNLGPAGLAVVFVRKSILENCNQDIGRYLRYDIQESKDSMFNTPPVFPIYDSSDGYYNCPVDVACRSHMNVVFRLPTEDLEKKFLTEAESVGLLNLKGHRSVGGCRASIYNALPKHSVETLIILQMHNPLRNNC